MLVLRTPRLSLRWFADRDASRYWSDGHGEWAIEQRSDGAVVGSCGLVDDPSSPRGLALACFVEPSVRRRGLAREASTACLAYARDVLRAERVIARPPADDAGARRLVESIGMRPMASDVGAFAWAAREAPDDGAEIDDLIAAFFSAFVNRGDAVPRVAAIPSMFVAGARITILRAGALETLGVAEFMAPRAALLFSGRLLDFHEGETASETTIAGGLAQRSSRYEKSGQLDGAPHRGAGRKLFQLVRTARGWRIAALAWEDDAT